MSWVSDYKYTWLQTVAMHVIKNGFRLPNHIAFVMDGNRRYANSQQIRKIEGHSKGFDKLADCLRWCLDIGIREVTTFAFSIENFKRSKEEVNGLLDLAREKFSKLLQEGPKLREHGVRIRVIGNIALLPEDLQNLIAQTMLETETNNKLFLNVAFSYTSRDEITHSVEQVLRHGDGLQQGDISERLLEECLYSRHSPPPDLLFRTSGETRISDFLMWQLNSTVLYFTKILWPEITIWNFLAGIFTYQRDSQHMVSFKKHERLKRAISSRSSNFYTDRVQRFLHRLDVYKRNMLLKWSTAQ
ncbi:dehydrodolichyl diphosphate synthase complex subunit Dhdds-like [Musca vetustissima]|uniref:dehydrodolichyl diphosphate synthase complex subunit Dhdds-like n=1 Tax=Musca vetustissima TaxID=27455 RepID=UPI002AB71B14|nr:dehydrodolichyl diphosphate synthase complex subunit Dhdds-like [Musca vetustissima]